LFWSFGLGLAGRFCRFPMGFPGSLRRLLTRAFDGFLCLSSYGLAGLLGFRAYGLSSLFCFLADRFSGLLCFLTYRFQSVLDCFARLLRAVLCVLKYALLAERSQRCGHDENSNQTRDFHIPFLLLIKGYIIGSDHAA